MVCVLILRSLIYRKLVLKMSPRKIVRDVYIIQEQEKVQEEEGD